MRKIFVPLCLCVYSTFGRNFWIYFFGSCFIILSKSLSSCAISLCRPSSEACCHLRLHTITQGDDYVEIEYEQGTDTVHLDWWTGDRHRSFRFNVVVNMSKTSCDREFVSFWRCKNCANESNVSWLTLAECCLFSLFWLQNYDIPEWRCPFLSVSAVSNWISPFLTFSLL